MIYVGTCGFSESMSKYFKDFKTVEIQQTFYRILEPKILEKWKKRAPKDFVFNFKVFQGITHPYNSKTWKRSNIDVSKYKDRVGFLKPTKEVFGFWEKMVEYARILESRVLVIQLPKSFKEGEESFENGEKFFRNIERKNFEIGVELRGWSEEGIRKFCKKFDVVDVCDLFFRDPLYRSKIFYFRLHGDYKEGKINYYYNYTKKDLEELKNKLKKFKTREVFVYFNNVFMLESSKQFLLLIR
ncbi:MAG: DUF72 domain-containing protein [Candidatus Aenigmarchaeota archaeon]|nr:DUF72 domain-containing protein [Candidatus Aenigmarchaeota archaeon]MCX8190741.1 DUF72 domain-containing protein [Candidatus Aenigmarchaeota archaeon]MDW8159989.1 DUF72 domain-containing protein [Candidatus Aenigmarchaeota archaeon]